MVQNVFVMLDVSGSIAKHAERIGEINDLMRSVFETLESAASMRGGLFVRVVTFSDKVKEIVPESDWFWYDLTPDAFGGVTFLAPAYAHIAQSVKKNGLDMAQTLIVLVTDGMPVDDYGEEERGFDPDNVSLRLYYGLGRKESTLASIHTNQVSAQNCHTLADLTFRIEKMLGC